MTSSNEDIERMLQRGEDTYREFKYVKFNGDTPAGPQQTNWVNEIIAFANTRGGTILFGATNDGKIQDMSQQQLKKLSEILTNKSNDDIEPAIRITTSNHVFSDGRRLLSVEVTEGESVHQGPGGAYIRSGSSIRKMPTDEALSLTEKRRHARFRWFDQQPVPETGFQTLDKSLWKPLLSSRSASGPELGLKNMQLLAKDEHGQMRATVAGILVCSKTPKQWLPHACIRAAHYRGNDQESDQLSAKTFDGPVHSQIVEALSFVHLNMQVAARKEPGRIDMPQYSMNAIFEAIVNAVVHRDYSIKESHIRLWMFEDRLEIYSPGVLPGNLTIESMPDRLSTRNETLISALNRIRIEDISGLESRQSFMKRTCTGVRIIRRETEELSSKSPKYRLIDNSELCLVIPAASVETSPESVVISVYQDGCPLPGINILGLFPNHTGKQTTTDEQGKATLDLHSIHLPMTVLAAADGFAAHVEKSWVPASRALAIEMNPLPSGGSVIFPAGTGHIPSLEGRLNPILDTYDRTYLYASNVAVNQGQKQPMHFIFGEELHLTDSNGKEKWIRIIDIRGRSVLVEYRSTPKQSSE